jgi:hypothetical protein
MTVAFRLDLVTATDLLRVSEEALASGWDGYRALVERQDPLEGTIVVEVAGQPVLEVHDELWAAAQNLCFAGAGAAAADEHCYLYRFTSSDSTVVVLPLASLVRLFGDTTPTLTAPKADLLPALFECGLRCIELYRRLGGDAVYQADYLTPFAEEARGRLREAGLLG